MSKNNEEFARMQNQAARKAAKEKKKQERIENRSTFENLASGNVGDLTEYLKRNNKSLSDIMALRDDGDNNLLHHIVINANSNLLDHLISNGALTEDNLNAKSSTHEKTPLHIAAAKGDVKTFHQLIAAGAKQDILNTKGIPPLHMFSLEDKKVREELLSKDIDVNVKGGDGSTALHMMSELDNAEAVKGLISKGADVNAQDNQGRTPLHIAAAENSSETLKLLVELIDEDGDLIVNNLQAKDRGGKTPLDYAIESKNTNSVQLLIDAYPNMNSEEKEAILAKVSENRSEEKSAIPIPQAQEVPAAAVAYTVPKVEEVESNLEDKKHAFSAEMTKKYMWTNTGVKNKARKIINGIQDDNLARLSSQENQGDSWTESLKGLGGLRKTDKEMLAEITEQFKSYAKDPSKQITLPSRYNLPSFGKKLDKGQTKQ